MANTAHGTCQAADLTSLFLALSNMEQAAKCAATQCLRLEAGEASTSSIPALVESIQRMAGKLSNIGVTQ